MNSSNAECDECQRSRGSSAIVSHDANGSGQKLATGGYVEDWGDEKIREVADGITLTATGLRPEQLNITIADCGEGQTPDRLPDTILSLGKSNKLRVPFVQGKFNQGGTGALSFCGSRNLQLVISRRNPSLAAPGASGRDADWGFVTLRALQSVALDNKPADSGPILSDLRNAEVWDDGEIINSALTPLANGDVFKLDDAEPDCPKSPRLFVVLGQPCDLALRSDGRRVSNVAMLVPLIELRDDGTPLPDPNDPDEDDGVKAPAFPFRMNGKRFRLDLRSTAYVKLSILDLACFRPDGRVRVELGHTPHSALLAGARAIYGDRTKPADDMLAAQPLGNQAAPALVSLDERLLLTMSDGKPWDRIRLGARLAAFEPGAGHHLKPLRDRVSWYLRRFGRIRAPYSSFLLERALRTLGRRAFDSDFTSD